MVLDRSMVQTCYDSTLNDLRDLEKKREELMASGIRTGCLGKDDLILKKREELEHIQYALDNMT